MSSSSTYNNVLLKPTMQTQTVTAPKRDLHESFAHSDFSQTFQELREKTQINNDRSARNEPIKKSASVEDSKRKTEAGGSKNLHAPKEHVSKENVSRENVSKEKPVKELNQSGNEDNDIAVANEQPIVKGKKASDKSVSTKDAKKTDESNDELAIANLSVSSTPVDSSEPLGLAIVLSAQETDAEMPQLSVGEESDSSNGLNFTVALGEGDVALNMETEPTPIINSLIETSDKDSATAILTPSDGTDLLAVKPVEPQAGVTQDSVTEVDAEMAHTQIAAAKLPTANTDMKQADIPLPNATLTSDVAGDVSTTPVAEKTVATPVKDTNALSDFSAATAQQTATEDPSSVFKKMLQTISKSVGREESAPVNPLQNNAVNSPSSSPLESFARFNDIQSPANRGFVVQTTVPVPVGQPQWSQAVGEKVLWLAAQNVSSAEINLHPKDLGPMQVKVSVNQEQTSVSFTSHHPVVREVLDQNLNRLRDMFSEQGLNLVNVDVSDKSFSRHQGDAQQQKGQTGDKSAAEEETITAVTTIVQQRLVDHYA